MDQNLIPKLRFHRALEGLSEAELEHFASHASTKRLEAGEVLLEPDQVVDALYLVMLGRLRVLGDFKNAENQTLRLIGPGEHFGALGIVLNQALPCTVLADQPTTMLRIPRDQLAGLLERYPLVRQNLSHSIGTALKASLLDKTASPLPRFVAWIQYSATGRHVVRHVAERLAALDESVAVLTDEESRYENTSVAIKSLKRDGQYLDVPDRADLLRDVSNHQRVFVDLDGTATANDLAWLIDSCDVVFWVAAEPDTQRAVSMLRKVVQSSPSRKDKLQFVCLPNEHDMVAQSIHTYHEFVAGDFKVPVRTDQTFDRLQKQGVERIVHYLRDVRLGIALGGGAARGMAHLGVLKVLESHGIFVDMMSGTSAGALTGVQYAAGYDPDFCVDSFETDLKPNWFFRILPKGDAWYLVTKYRTRAWDRMLRSYLHQWNLEQLPIPFKGVSVDLIRGSQVIYHSGDAVRTIVESINLPGVSAPICRDGMALIDGGTLNVLPADVLVNGGCNYVIAVNVSSKITHQFGRNRPDTPTDMMRAPGIRQTLARERIVQDRSMNAIGARPADFVIEPDISGYAVTDFPKTREIAQQGYDAAEAVIDALKESLQRVDAKLFATLP